MFKRSNFLVHNEKQAKLKLKVTKLIEFIAKVFCVTKEK